jgi:8-oxo-dGTP diphosphatase
MRRSRITCLEIVNSGQWIVGGEYIAVVAAIIEDGDRFLVTRRQKGVHLEGLWEFPGGKVDDGESHEAALQREIREELDADIAVSDLVLHTTHAYPEKTVALYFYRCSLTNVPRPLLGQEMQWVPRKDLAGLPFPAADEALIRQLVESAAR